METNYTLKVSGVLKLFKNAYKVLLQMLFEVCEGVIIIELYCN